MEFRIISLPSFKAASSGLDKNFDFSPTGVLGKFNTYFSAIKPMDRDSFMPRDFLYYDEKNKAVSYTHLDVYKRQIVYTPLLPNGLHNKFAAIRR